MKNYRKNPYRQLLTAALLFGGTFQIASSVLAQTAPTPTSASTSISNTATATYSDAGNPTGPALTSTSNTVSITVAEIAGLYINTAGVVDGTTGTSGIQANDTIFFDFDVTNVGNDPTRIVIPNLARIAGSGTVSGSLQYQLPGQTTFTAITGTSFTTPTSIQPGASVRVRVPVTVAGVSTGTITVTLGDTTPSAAQNVPYLNTPGSIYTQDNNASTGDTPIAEVTTTGPANGEREASTNQSATINATDQAFATLLKSLTSYSQNNTPNLTNDDILTYGLSLRVEGSPPSASSTTSNAAPLTGTTFSGGVGGSGNNINTNFILISDAIPAGTDLNAAPVAPTGWRVVYSSTATTTPANQATWETAPPSTLSSVIRVGFIYDPDNNLTTPSPAIAPNTTVTGFSLSVNTEATFGTTGTTGGQIANIAQVFGTSNGGTTLVYDESGDQNPSNFNDSGTPGSNAPTSGVANPNNDGTDPGNNSGTDPAGNTVGGGEDNIFNIPTPGVSAVLLGPEGAAGATGPTNNNDDFTNRAASFPTADTPQNTDTTDPNAVAFVNTIQNNGSSPANISIIPTTPANLGLADLPTGTLVTISATGVSGSRLYVWTGSAFEYDTDQNPATSGSNSIDLAAEVLTIPNVPANGGISAYNVSIDLPANTRLSTDLVSFEAGDSEYGYPVPVTAFVESGTANGVIDSGEASNTSIDRIYVGFLRLLKESRLVPGFGPAFPAGQEVFSTASKTPAPGNRVEYQITYTNISSVPATGSGSLGLNANNIVITENGTVLPNNWGRDSDAAGTPGFGQIDTLNVPGTAIESGGIVPAYFTGTTGSTPSGDVANVTGYTVNTGAAPVLGPSQFRTFRFQRQIDE